MQNGDLEDALEQHRANLAMSLVKSAPNRAGLLPLNLSSKARTLGSLLLNYRNSQTGYHRVFIFKQPGWCLNCPDEKSVLAGGDSAQSEAICSANYSRKIGGGKNTPKLTIFMVCVAHK